MKKTSVLLLCLVLILTLTSFLTAGCSSDTTSTPSATATPTATAPTTTAPTTTAPVTGTPKTFTIKFIPATSGPPPQKGLSLVAREWARIIEEATNGRIKTDIYYSESLAKGNDIVAAVETGLADAAMIRQHAEAGKVPLSTVGEMPGISSDFWAMSMAFCDLMHSDLMKAEFDSHNMVPFTSTFADDTFVLGNKAVRTIEDLKKIKIASSGINGQVISALGGTPLSISPPEMYEALYRGTIDAIGAPVSAIHGFKFYEIADYFTYLSLGGRMHPIVFNKDTWDSFGPELQQILTDLIPELVQSSYDSLMETANDGFTAMEGDGVEMITLSEADLALVDQAYETVYASWVADKTKAGLPAQAVMDKYREFGQHYESISPYK
jgi:TRAP-type C4-dicarboxylate transport system substrate-binding protein